MDATAQFIFAVLQTALFSSVVIICFSCCCEKKKGRPSHYQGSYEGNVQSLQPYAQSVPGSATTPPISNSCYQPTPFQQPPRVMRSMKSQRNNQTRPHPPPFPAASSQPGGPYPPPPSPLMRPAMPAVNSPIGAAYPPPMHPTSPLFDPMPYPNSQPMSPAAGRGAGWNPQAFQPQAQPPILVGPPAFGGPSPYGMPPPSAAGGLTASQRLAKINMTPAVVHPAPPSARHARSARSLSSKRDSSKSGKGSSKSTTGTGGDSQRTSSSSKSEADRRNQRRRSADRRKK